MRLFKSKAETEQEQSLDVRMRKWDLFPGNLEEFNQLKGVEHIIMDTHLTHKYVSQQWSDYREVSHRLVREGCVGLIHYVPMPRASLTTHNSGIGGYGVPVKRKELVSEQSNC